MSKGSNRRPTDEVAYAEGFDRIFRNKTKASSPNGKAPGSTPEDLCSNQSEAANQVVYVDDATGKMVDEDYWP